jgi:hypothetical protein
VGAAVISLKLNPVSDFKTDKPDELNRQLSQLEDSHEDALRTLAEKSLTSLTVTSLRRAQLLAKVGELTEVDTSTAVVLVQLPAPSQQNAGRDLVIALSSGSNSVTVKPVAGAINGAASISISGIGATRIYSTGRAWYA